MSLSFRRIDLEIIVRRTDDENVAVRVGHPGSYDDLHFDLETASNLISNLLVENAFSQSMSDWFKRNREAYAQLNNDEQLIHRLALDIIDPEIASLPWEDLLAPLVVSLPFRAIVVRVSQMRPSWALVPFTVPLRILNVEPSSPGALPSVMRTNMGRSQPDEIVDQSVRVKELQFWELEYGLTAVGWPSAEIIHFEGLPSLNDETTLLKTSVPNELGTLGWFARVCDLWETRLIVVECHSPRQAIAAHRLATALINRGGPAVLVSASLAKPFFRQFYWNLLHDFPLDESILSASSYLPSSAEPIRLFAGARREEALRISNLGLALLRLGQKLSIEDTGLEGVSEMHDLARLTTAEYEGEPLTQHDASKIVMAVVESISAQVDVVTEDLSLREIGLSTSDRLRWFSSLIENYYVDRALVYSEATRPPELNPEWTVGQVINTLASGVRVLPLGEAEIIHEKSQAVLETIERSLTEFKGKWDTLRFDLHESEGYIPVTKHIAALRDEINLTGPLSYESGPKLTGPRYLNASLWSEENDEQDFAQLNQTTTRLIVGQTYHLGIQIGPKDIRIRTFGEAALIEEVFNWSPEMEGVWVEFAVTGIDFDVLGDPVRELWLPRERPSEMIYFAVSPRVAGACRLRYCLYYQQNVIQSFRLAAITMTAEESELPAEVRREQLSHALDLPLDAIGDAAYLPRLEYSLTASVESVETRPARLMSIVANDLDGKPVVTVKGSDDFRVLTPPDLSNEITAVRDAFTNISANKLETEKDRFKWPYAFGEYAAQPQTLQAALKELAAVGWRLYDKIFRLKTQNRLGEALDKDPKVIHVAHVLLDKVIPWAALYDRQYKPDMTADDQLRVIDHAACLAALPDADGKFPVLECAKHPECLLHPDQIQKRETEPNSKHLVPETVACPLHFWGFKHIIEIPPQQVDEDGEPLPQADFILADSALQMISGANVSLKLWPKHLVNLNKFKWKAQAVSGATLDKALKDADLDFIYLYCHAGGGQTDPNGKDPHLLFQDEQAKPQKIRAGDFPLSPEWAHHPLVFLNGCGTLGYTPDALSPFIKKLVGDLGASGVIGTEITVWEELAIDVAEQFLERFLARSSAGDALLAVRRTLLNKKNPLGLVYTLYAPAHLKLKEQ